MQKSIRLFVFVAILSCTAAPSLHAERMGTNPHPSATTTGTSTWDVIVYTVRGYFGL